MPNDTTPTGIQIATIRVMTEAGSREISRADSGMGDVFRPQLSGEYGSSTANLETLYDFWINNVPDPDTALANNPDFDEVLRQHPDVHMCMSVREKTVAGLPVRFEAAKKTGDDDLCEKIRGYVEERFNAIPARTDMYVQYQNSVLMGGQGFEYNWQLVEGYAAPIKWQPVHKSRFVFDRLGNMALLTRTQPVWGGYVSYDPQAKFPVTGDGKPLNPVFFPRGKFVYHQYSTGSGGTWSRTADEGYRYYGRGEDTNLFTLVTFDNFVLRFQIKWLEKFGIPLALLYYPENESMSGQINDICESIRGESTVRIPRPVGTGTENDWWKIEWHEPSGQGYEAFMDYHNSYTSPRIEKILLGGASQMEVEAGGYAASVSQKDFGPNMIYKHDARKISETINEQLIPNMVLARWPGVPSSYFPKHIMEPKEEVDREMQVGILLEGATAVRVRNKDLYEAMGVQEPEEEDETFFLGQDPLSEFDTENIPGGRPGGASRDKKNAGSGNGKSRGDKSGKAPIGKKGNSKGLAKSR